MKVSDIVLAQHAEVDAARHVTFRRDGFAVIFTEKLPYTAPSLYLLLRLQTTKQDKGINRLEIRLVGRDGSYLKAEGSMSVTEDEKDDPDINMPLHFRNTVFQTAGSYNFQVFINGTLGASRPFRVEHNSARLS